MALYLYPTFFVDREQQPQTLTSEELYSKNDCLEVLSNIDRFTDRLLSNEMTNHKTTIASEGVHPSPPLVEYSPDEIEHSSRPYVTIYSNKRLTLVLLYILIHLLFILAVILLVLIIRAGIHLIQLL